MLKNMSMRKTLKVAVALMVIPAVAFAQQFTLGKKGYFERGGINVMAFQDTYPEGHQSGVCVIMNGNRVATNGDLRLEATPGQWQPLPKQKKRTVGENEMDFENALKNVPAGIRRQADATPYGVPYQPSIWGAGWDIQSFGYQQYFLVSEYPEIFDVKPMLSALNFVLGCHPGSNQASFASGVGAQSATVGYGLNRADWSYIPGGVISGTAMIRPDFPELLTWPYLWQQTEYVLGGGSSHYMFLVLAAQQLCK